MARGQRKPKTKVSDNKLKEDHDPTEVLDHPDRGGYTIQCRSCGTTNPGMWAEKQAGYRGAIWFCDDPDCQEAFIRRQKLIRFDNLPAHVRDGLPPGDVSDLIEDNQVE